MWFFWPNIPLKIFQVKIENYANDSGTIPNSVFFFWRQQNVVASSTRTKKRPLKLSPYNNSHIHFKIYCVSSSVFTLIGFIYSPIFGNVRKNRRTKNKTKGERWQKKEWIKISLINNIESSFDSHRHHGPRIYTNPNVIIGSPFIH